MNVKKAKTKMDRNLKNLKPQNLPSLNLKAVGASLRTDDGDLEKGQFLGMCEPPNSEFSLSFPLMVIAYPAANISTSMFLFLIPTVYKKSIIESTN